MNILLNKQSVGGLVKKQRKKIKEVNKQGQTHTNRPNLKLYADDINERAKQLAKQIITHVTLFHECLCSLDKL